ncbi:DUF4190 domain-containing protein [Microbacterium sp. P5_E9]
MSMNPPGPEQPPQPGYQPPPSYGAPPQHGYAGQPAYPGASPYPPPSAYPSAPPPTGQYSAPPPAAPGRTLGIVALILSFFMSLVGLILGIIALVQSRRAGQRNGFALAAIIIGAVLTVVGIIVTIAIVSALGAAAAEYARLCAEYGSGTHTIGGVDMTLICPSE